MYLFYFVVRREGYDISGGLLADPAMFRIVAQPWIGFTGVFRLEEG
jgi:hypothetical protein